MASLTFSTNKISFIQTLQINQSDYYSTPFFSWDMTTELPNTDTKKCNFASLVSDVSLEITIRCIIIFCFLLWLQLVLKSRTPPQKKCAEPKQSCNGVKSICVVKGWLRVQCFAPCCFAITLMWGIWGYQKSVLPHKELNTTSRYPS